MDFDLDQVLEMVDGDGQEREIELSCKLMELILLIVMMMWLVDLVMLFGLKRLQIAKFLLNHLYFLCLFVMDNTLCM